MVGSLRQSSAVFSRFTMVAKCAKTMSPMAPPRYQRTKRDGQRLVVIVFANHDHATGATPGLAHCLVIGQRRKRRLLDQHVFAGGERTERQVAMKLRWHRDYDGVHTGILDRLGVGAVRGGAAEAAAICIGSRAIAAGVADNDRGSERSQMPAMDIRNETAAKEGEPQRAWHQTIDTRSQGRRVTRFQGRRVAGFQGCRVAGSYRIAIGATVDPVPPLIFSGCTTNANS